MNHFFSLRRIAPALAALGIVLGLALPLAVAGSVDATTLVTTSLGTFNDVPYNQYEAMFQGTTSTGHPYRVPCRIIAPAVGKPRSGVVLFDWLDAVLIPLYGQKGFETPLARIFFGDDFLFGNGHVYATVRTNPVAAGAPWLFDSFNASGVPSFSGFHVTGETIAAPADEFDIVADFVRALSSDPVAAARVGPISRRVAFGYSDSGWRLRGLVRNRLGRGLFDLSVSGGAGAITAQPSGSSLSSRTDPLAPPVEGGREISINTESEALQRQQHLDIIRQDAPNERSYELAGAAHLPDTPFFEAGAVYFGLPDLDAINPLDWTPFLRGLFVAGLQWCDGVEPPPSIWLAGNSDPSIARDANGNALIRYVGGNPVDTTSYRHPEVAVGLGQYIGLYPSNDLLRVLFGGFADLSSTFASHDDYVAAITAQADFLSDAGYLLPADADAIIQDAEDSTVGGP